MLTTWPRPQGRIASMAATVPLIVPRALTSHEPASIGVLSPGRPRQQDASVVDPHVEAPRQRNDLVPGGLQLPVVPHVHIPWHCLRTELGRGAARCVAVHIGDEDEVSSLHEQTCELLAHPAPGTGDDGTSAHCAFTAGT